MARWSLVLVLVVQGNAAEVLRTAMWDQAVKTTADIPQARHAGRHVAEERHGHHVHADVASSAKHKAHKGAKVADQAAAWNELVGIARDFNRQQDEETRSSSAQQDDEAHASEAELPGEAIQDLDLPPEESEADVFADQDDDVLSVMEDANAEESAAKTLERDVEEMSQQVVEGEENDAQLLLNGNGDMAEEDEVAEEGYLAEVPEGDADGQQEKETTDNLLPEPLEQEQAPAARDQQQDQDEGIIEEFF